MNETYKIRSIGGSLLVVIPQYIARAMNLKAGDDVAVSAYDVGRRHEAVIVRPAKPKPTTKGKTK